MTAYFEVRSTGLPELVTLERERLTVGRAAENDIVLDDRSVSKLHAVFERYAEAWCVRDLGSANGTFVNGRPVSHEVRLQPGDEVSVGRSRLIFRSDQPAPADLTDRASPPPDLTKRERAVLIALCRPVLSGDTFAEPASIRAMAAELVVSEAAVKFHLANLYDKFALYDGDGSRRSRLANEALRRRAISVADLSQPSDR